jgi:cytochrome c-type biogenesis protein CcmF
MFAEIGRFSLILALILSLVQTVSGLIGPWRGIKPLVVLSRSAAVGQFIFIATAFACLIYLFAVSDFSVMVVAENSHTSKPMFYKVAAAWGHHEGSMLLWVLVLSLFGAAIALLSPQIPEGFKARVLGVQGLIGLSFLAFIIFTSNPFQRLFPVPLQGNGFNPLLQDPGIVSHPPMLYLGYVGFSTAFSFATAALIEGRGGPLWVRYARPWILTAWVCLTIGITLGSLWAYAVLGWGGWWFWDPVENASLMPWLLGTALVHSALVVERRFTLERWTLLLGILTFSMSLLGTFVVRSGILTSVHAFAVDPARGAFILAILVMATGGGLALYALRAPGLASGKVFGLFSREGSLVLNNILLVTITGTVFLGTFYPLLIELVSTDKISVGVPYYALTFVPLAMPLLAAMVIGPLLMWRKDPGKDLLKRVAPGLFAVFAGVVITAAATRFHNLLAPVWLGLAGWLIVGSFLILVRRARVGQIPWRDSLKLARALPLATHGAIVAHLGVGLLVAGLGGATTSKQEGVAMFAPNQSVPFAGMQLRIKEVTSGKGPNFDFVRAEVQAVHRDGSITTLRPERRFYPERQSETTKASVRETPLGNLYVALGEQSSDGRWTLRYYTHPLAIWIWLGGAVMALGGVLALIGNRNLQVARDREEPRPRREAEADSTGAVA